MRKTLELDFVWEGSLYIGYTVSRQEIKLQLLKWDNLRIANNALSTCLVRINVVFGVGVLHGSTSG